MTTRRFLAGLLLFPVLLCCGCAGTDLRPAHLTILCERDEAEADGARGSRQRTVTTKTGATLTWDLR